MTSKKTRIAALIVAAAALPLTLAACGSSTTSSTSAPSLTPSASASPSATLIGGDPATWSPVELTMNENGATINLVAGQVAIITGLPATDGTNNIVVTSDNPDVVTGLEGDGAKTNYGFMAVAPGDAHIVVENGFSADKGDAQPVVQYDVHVTANEVAVPASDAPVASMAPSAAAVQ